MNNPNVAPSSGEGVPFSSPTPTVASKSGHPPEFTETLDVAEKTSQIPMSFPASIKNEFELSNAETVANMPYKFGQQGQFPGNPPMAPQGARPSFEKLELKAGSTAPGPMGTDYKP
jgi:hypothetical protein